MGFLEKAHWEVKGTNLKFETYMQAKVKCCLTKLLHKASVMIYRSHSC